MNTSIIASINPLIYRQEILTQTVQLAERFSGLGINPDTLHLLPLNEVIGHFNFLRKKLDAESDIAEGK